MGTQTYGYLLNNGVYSSYRLLPYDEFWKYYRDDGRVLRMNKCYWLNLGKEFSQLNELMDYLFDNMRVGKSSIKDIQSYKH